MKLDVKQNLFLKPSLVLLALIPTLGGQGRMIVRSAQIM